MSPFGWGKHRTEVKSIEPTFGAQEQSELGGIVAKKRLDFVRSYGLQDVGDSHYVECEDGGRGVIGSIIRHNCKTQQKLYDAAHWFDYFESNNYGPEDKKIGSKQIAELLEQAAGKLKSRQESLSEAELNKILDDLGLKEKVEEKAIVARESKTLPDEERGPVVGSLDRGEWEQFMATKPSRQEIDEFFRQNSTARS